MIFPKVFTVQQANAFLPQLQQTFDAIDQRMAAVERATERLQILDVLWGDAVREPENPDYQENEAHRLEIVTLMSEVEELVQEKILDQGLRFPPGGLEHGLIDFPTTLDGRYVFLCWHRDESSLCAWHEIDGGFAGRHALTSSHAEQMGEEASPQWEGDNEQELND